MAFQVDQCKNFKDGKKCEKCGRMMPAYCKDQQDLEEKARLFDELVASGKIETVQTVKTVETEKVVGSVDTETNENPTPSPVIPERDVVASGNRDGKPQNAPATKGRRKVAK